MLARCPNEPQGFTRVEPAIVERASRDRAGELSRARLEQRLDVFDRGQSAGRDYRRADRFCERKRSLEIKALEQAIARNVSVNDRRHSGVFEALRKLGGCEIRRTGPPFNRDPAVAGIEADGNAAGKGPSRMF